MLRLTRIHLCAVLSAAGVLGLFPFSAGADDLPLPCDFLKAGLSCSAMQISVCPAGDFEPIRKGGGASADFIWIEVRDTNQMPLPGVPATDYWLGSCDAATELALCASPLLADSATGSNGRTSISGQIVGGGCALSGGVWIAVQGKVVPDCLGRPLCLPVIIKGPDITGEGGLPDGVVNLSDLIPFGRSYNKTSGNPDFNPCCDFNDDNSCNLSDFAFFSTHYQHGCL